MLEKLFAVVLLNKKKLYIMFCDHAAMPPGTKANGYSIVRPRNF
jgi:hypothetical protein